VASNRHIAYLGMGIMGASMAANLARAGFSQNFSVKVWNRTAGRAGLTSAVEAGAVACQSVKEAVDGAEAVFLCLGEEADLQDIVFRPGGVAASASPGTIVVDMSTTGPGCARETATKLQEHKLVFLDAPVTGGDVGARNGTLTIMVGGESAVFEKCLPFFQAIGKTIKHCGPVGSGQSLKLCNQVLCAVNMVAVCEAFELAEELGIDPNLVVEVCGSGAAASWALSNLGPRIINGDFKPGFKISHMMKDLRLVRENLNGVSRTFPGTKLAEEMFALSAKLPGTACGDQGTQAMMLAYKEN
jgi:3-hydroxyisobutyrate dehydrogenase